MRRILIDTGPLVALLNRRDAHHAWSVAQADRFEPPFHSCEAVLSEAHFLLEGVPGGRERLIALVESGRIDLSFSCAGRHDRAAALMLQYRRVPMAFADACLVCMAEQHPATVFTVDGGFRIYRIHQDQPLDVLMP